MEFRQAGSAATRISEYNIPKHRPMWNPQNEDRQPRAASPPKADPTRLAHCGDALSDIAAIGLAAQTCVDAMLGEVVVCTRQTPRAWRPHWMAFQWCCIAGRWELADVMLERCCRLSSPVRPFLDQYRACLQAESHRAKIFHDGRTDYPSGSVGTNRQIRGQLEHWPLASPSTPDAPAVDCSQTSAPAGATNLGSFTWLKDGDDRLGPIIEVFLGECYVRIPFERIARIDLARVTCLLDRVWRPVVLLLRDGWRQAGFVPARYIESQSASDALKLGYRTLWTPRGAAHRVGLGERQYCFERGRWPLSRLTTICFLPSTSERG
ncbi:type VI secretion system accessory protein TagJ [Cupriavidus necator]